MATFGTKNVHSALLWKLDHTHLILSGGFGYPKMRDSYTYYLGTRNHSKKWIEEKCWIRIFFIFFAKFFTIFDDFSKFSSTFGVLHIEKSSIW